ncbi:MAG: N-acetyltransferase [Deltaproteobacteria bacterium]|nr:N-acetyltransferase [Candidatus Zymogenaceae bacterium]
MTIRDARSSDVPEIVDIYNESVIFSTATFDTTPKTIEDYTVWFSAHDAHHPVVVAEEAGAVAGWAALSAYSDRAAYDGTAEVSLYVRRSCWNRGIGGGLFSTIVDRGRHVGLHTVISRIAEGNEVSVALHTSRGFTAVGVMRQVGKKFGRMLDVIIMQLIYDRT